jgi:anti-sigma factor RsiW
MPIDRHFSFDELTAFVEGRMEPEKASQVRAHLATGCAACLDDVRFLKRISAAVQAANNTVPAPSPHQQTKTDLPVVTKSPNLFRRFAPAFFSLAIVLVAMVFFFRLGATNAAALSQVSGMVEIRYAPNMEWQTATTGQIVQVGAEVRTSANGQATLVFPGGSQARLAPGTQLKFGEYASHAGTIAIVMDQSAGEAEYWIAENSGGYTLMTSAGNMLSSSGHFQVQVGTDGQTIIKVSEGKVQVASGTKVAYVVAGQTAQLSMLATPTILSGPTPLASFTKTSLSGSNGIAATHTPKNTQVPQATHTPKNTQEHQPTNTPKNTPVHQPTHTPKNTPEHQPTHTPKNTPEHKPTHTPKDTPDNQGPQPTKTPKK